MNDKYIIAEEGGEALERDGAAAGYQFRIRVPYYMGVPFSQVEHIRVRMDGEDVPQGSIRVLASTGEEFTLDEMKTVYTYFWEYGEKLRVLVLRPGGLPAGGHRLEVDVAVDVIYAPKGFGTRAQLDFTT